MILAVYHGQFLDLVFLQDSGSSLQVGLLMRSYKILAGHHLVDCLIESTLKAQVTIGHDTHQMVFVINHGNAADMIVVHDFQRVLHGLATTNGHGVVNHTVFGTLHDGHLMRLFLDRHILMNHTDTPLSCYRNGHGRLGNGVHSGRYERNIKRDITRKACFQLYRLG